MVFIFLCIRFSKTFVFFLLPIYSTIFVFLDIDTQSLLDNGVQLHGLNNSRGVILNQIKITALHSKPVNMYCIYLPAPLFLTSSRNVIRGLRIRRMRRNGPVRFAKKREKGILQSQFLA